MAGRRVDIAVHLDREYLYALPDHFRGREGVLASFISLLSPLEVRLVGVGADGVQLFEQSLRFGDNAFTVTLPVGLVRVRLAVHNGLPGEGPEYELAIEGHTAAVEMTLGAWLENAPEQLRYLPEVRIRIIDGAGTAKF